MAPVWKKRLREGGDGGDGDKALKTTMLPHLTHQKLSNSHTPRPRTLSYHSCF